MIEESRRSMRSSRHNYPHDVPPLGDTRPKSFDRRSEGGRSKASRSPDISQLSFPAHFNQDLNYEIVRHMKGIFQTHCFRGDTVVHEEIIQPSGGHKSRDGSRYGNDYRSEGGRSRSAHRSRAGSDYGNDRRSEGGRAHSSR